MEHGGAQAFVMNVFRNINRENIEFDFLVTASKRCAYDDEIKALGGNIYYISSRRKGVLKNWIELKQFFRFHKYECIHFHTSCPSYIEPIIAAKKAGVKKIILHSHSSSGPYGFYHKLMRIIYRPQIKYFATHFFACSMLAAEWMYGKYIPFDKIAIIPNGIETYKFRYNEEIRYEKRREIGIGQDKQLIGHVGRFSNVKNHDFLINVFKAIHEKEKNSNLLLVGDGILLEDIKRKVNQLGISNEVLFLTNRNDISELMQAMDVFILPSFYEGLPVTLVEAQATGLPCIVSNTVSSESKLTNLVEFISLDASICHWRDAIISRFGKNNNRIQFSDMVKNSGFDITEIAQMLEKVYVNIETK